MIKHDENKAFMGFILSVLRTLSFNQMRIKWNYSLGNEIWVNDKAKKNGIDQQNESDERMDWKKWTSEFENSNEWNEELAECGSRFTESNTQWK